MEYTKLLKAGLVDDDTLSGWMVDANRRRLEADLVARAYERRRPKIQDWIREKLIREHGSAEDWAVRRDLDANWTLNDLIKKHAWLRDEADSLNLAIQTQLALRAALNEQRVDLS
jgi:hypothetical protein